MKSATLQLNKFQQAQNMHIVTIKHHYNTLLRDWGCLRLFIIWEIVWYNLLLLLFRPFWRTALIFDYVIQVYPRKSRMTLKIFANVTKGKRRIKSSYVSEVQSGIFVLNKISRRVRYFFLPIFFDGKMKKIDNWSKVSLFFAEIRIFLKLLTTFFVSVQWSIL